jgi:hypothetical protein
MGDVRTEEREDAALNTSYSDESEPPTPEREPTATAILRSTFTSDVANDSEHEGIIYAGNTIHGVLHAIDSTGKQQPMHIWLGDIKLWTMAVEHVRMKYGCDTFEFTPFSSAENWDKMHPELKIVGSMRHRNSSPKKKQVQKQMRSHNNNNMLDDFFDKIFMGSPLSITVKVLLLSVTLYAYMVLCFFITYYILNQSMIFNDGDKRCVSIFGYLEHCTVVVSGESTFVATFREFINGHAVGLSKAWGMIYAALQRPTFYGLMTKKTKRGVDLGYAYVPPPKRTKSGGSKRKSLVKLLKSQRDEKRDEDKNIAYDGSDLIEWINSNGGFIHPNARIGLDPTGQYRGVFVRSIDEGGTEKGIEDDDIIATIPWDLIVAPHNYRFRDYRTSCDALHEMHRQFQLGDESKYAPYINYLKNQPVGLIPSEWSEPGKRLLRRILDQDGYSGLPPFDALDRFEQIWMKECNGEDSPLARAAFFQVTSRDEDSLMVPFYDMHNHSNDPKKINARPETAEEEGEDFVMYATKDIAPGEQILISYNRCHGCWFDTEYKDCKVTSHYGTDQLFSQFGFVEDYPQFWKIPQYDEDGEFIDEVSFCLDRNDDGGSYVRRFGDNYSDEDEEEPNEVNIKWFKEQLRRLQRLESTMKSNRGQAKSVPSYKESLPSHEWQTAWKYHNNLVNAISSAIDAVEVEGYGGDDNMPVDSSDDDSSDDDEIEMAFFEDVVIPAENDYEFKDNDDEELMQCDDSSDDDSDDDDCEDYLEDDKVDVSSHVGRKKVIMKGK